MRAAVFVKQVPDVRAGSVGTRPDGTIDGSSAPAITNPADLHTLEAALQVAEDVVAISMGPAAAESAARDALAYGATDAVLVTDGVFAGSDTWATANVLASAVRRPGDFDLYLRGACTYGAPGSLPTRRSCGAPGDNPEALQEAFDEMNKQSGLKSKLELVETFYP